MESRVTAMRMIGESTFSDAIPITAPAVARTCVPPRPTPVATPPAVIDATADETVLQMNVG